MIADFWGTLHQLLLKINITIDPEKFLAMYALVIARIGSAIPYIPFLGGESIPGQISAGLAMVIGILLFPALSAQAHDTVPTFGTFIACILKELLIGNLIGIMVQIVFTAVEGAGSLIEFTASLKPDEVMAPQLPSATGPLSRFMGQAAIVLYVTAGVHFLFIRALAESYLVIPLLDFPTFRPGFFALAELTGRIVGGFISVAFQIAAPILLLLVLIQVASNMVFRLAFQGVQKDPLQPLATLAVYGSLFVALGLLASEIIRQSMIYLSQIRNFIAGMK